MSVHIHRSDTEGWTQVPNRILRDPSMTARARGILVTLLSHEDGWQQSISFTSREVADGRDGVAAALRELEALGYVHRVKRHSSSGRWVWDHHVYDRTDMAVSPGTVAPSTVKASIDVEALDVEPQEPKTLNDEESQPPDQGHPEALQLCSLLAGLIHANGSKRPTITKAWVTQARLLIERDERPPEAAALLVRWAQADPFWRGVILSMPKFRQRYDQLRLARERDLGDASIRPHQYPGDVDVTQLDAKSLEIHRQTVGAP